MSNPFINSNQRSTNSHQNRFFTNNQSNTNQTRPPLFSNSSRDRSGIGTQNNNTQGRFNSNSNKEGAFFQNERGQGNRSVFSNNSFSSRNHRKTVGSFETDYNPKGEMKGHSQGKVLLECFLLLPEHSQDYSLLAKRAEDYNLIQSGKIPENNQSYNSLGNYLNCGHFNEKMIDKNVYDRIKNSNTNTNNMGGIGLKRQFTFGDNDNRGRFNSFSDNNNNSSNSFLNNRSGNNTRNLGGGFLNQNKNQGQNNSSQGSFFNNTNSTMQGSNGNSTFFNNSQRGGNTQSKSFFNNNNGGSQSFFNNSGGNNSNNNMGSSFLNRNNSNQSNSQNPSTPSFLNRNSNGNSNNQTQSSFFNNSTQQNSTQQNSFFNRGSNQSNSLFNNKDSTGNQSNLFSNNRNNNQQASFFNNNNNGNNNNQQQPSFFNNNNKPNNSSFFNNNNNRGGNGSNQDMNYYNNQMNDPYFIQNPIHMQRFFQMQNPLYMEDGPRLINPPQNPYQIPPWVYSPQMYNPYIPQYSHIPYNYHYPKRKNSKEDFLNERLEREKNKEYIDELDRKYEEIAKTKLCRKLKEANEKSMLNNKFGNIDLGEYERSSFEPLKRKEPAKLVKFVNKATKGREISKKSNLFRSRLSQTEDDQKLNSTFLRKTDRILTLKVGVKFIDDYFYKEGIEINKNRSVGDLKKYILEEIPKFNFSVEELSSSSDFKFGRVVFQDSKKLKDIEEIENCDIVLEINKKINEKDSKEERRIEMIEEINNPDLDDICPKKLLPVFTKSNYNIHPPMTEIARMKTKEIKKVKDFSIWNEYGKIEWLGETDLTEINIDLWVLIKKEGVEVYPEDLFSESAKPTRGTKLNKQCIITLNNIFPRNERQANDFEKHLRIVCDKQDAVHHSYDDEEGIWKFKVFHFTKYSFLDMEEEEEEEIIIEEEKNNDSFKASGIEEIIREEDSEEEKESSPKKQSPDNKFDLRSNKFRESRNSKYHTIFGMSKVVEQKIKPEPDFKDTEATKIKEKMDDLRDLINDNKRETTMECVMNKPVSYNKMDMNLAKDIHKANSLLVDVPFVDNDRVVIKDFSFPVFWNLNDSVGFINNGNNESKLIRNKQFRYYNMNNGLLESIEKAFEKVYKKKERDSFMDLKKFYQFIIGFYNQLKTNMAEYDNKTLIVKLEMILAFFSLYNFDINKHSYDNDISRIIEEYKIFSDEEDLVNQVKRKRPIFKWLDGYLRRSTGFPDISFMSDQWDSHNNDYLSKIIPNNFDDLSQINPKEEKDQEYTFFENFRKAMKENKNKTIKEIYENFNFQVAFEDDTELARLFQSCLDFILNKKNFNLFNQERDDSIENKLIQMIFLQLQVLMEPELKVNNSFMKQRRRNYNQVYESLLQNKAYFSALMLFTFDTIPRNKVDGFIEHTLSLNFEDPKSPKISSLQLNIIYNHFPKKSFKSLKIIKYYSQGEYDVAMKALVDLDESKKAYNLLVEKVCKQRITPTLLNEKELDFLLVRFETLEKNGHIRENDIGFIIYNYLKLQEDFLNNNIDEIRTKEYIEGIFELIQHVKRDILSLDFCKNKDLLRIISTNTLKLISGGSYEGQRNVLHFFKEGIIHNRFFCLFDDESLDEIILELISKIN